MLDVRLLWHLLSTVNDDELESAVKWEDAGCYLSLGGDKDEEWDSENLRLLVKEVSGRQF